jgi:gamma-polyglutamate biosynthesis protein CapA
MAQYPVCRGAEKGVQRGNKIWGHFLSMRDARARLVAVGDVMLGDHPLCIGFGVGSSKAANEAEYFFDKVKHILREGDICFGNLECVLSDVGIEKRSISSVEMRGLPMFAGSMRDAGFSVMSIANNHTMQHGYEAFDDTKRALTKVGIKLIGLKGEEGHCLPEKIDAGGLIVSFLGYSLRPEKYVKPTSYADGPRDVILEDIRREKTLCDVVVVSIHWGDEFVTTPSAEQIDMGHACIEAGASVVLGHHPHLLQGIEEYGKGLIAYSLGNFVFDFWQKRLRETIVLKCDLSKEGVDSFDVVPVWIDGNYRPVPMDDGDAQRLKAKVRDLSNLIRSSRGNLGADSRTYLREVKRQELRNKIENRLFFLRNVIFFRYKGGVLSQSLHRFLKTRR